jgi:hypothetical protein
MPYGQKRHEKEKKKMEKRKINIEDLGSREERTRLHSLCSSNRENR